ncbi:Ig-like domain-containing protein [Marinoscillum sp. MHG1-6]|uniref:Ig-like domain-containing protein n=1 Tax=Marinoscillum sp. MHG1-6 TaxID=2959627 RepID=UPI0021574A33|nr:Ig-like domain-containing protein [Marinoscillum sp. MHG1-6]
MKNPVLYLPQQYSYGNRLKKKRPFSFLKLACLIFFIQLTTLAVSQPYSYPYEIPRFQDFMGECKLQAPTSSTAATTAELIAGYTSSWFYVADVDKVAFNQSGYANRTELRDLRNWLVSDGDRSLHGRFNVVEQTCDQVTLMQIHDDANAGNGPNKPLLRIYRHLVKSPTNHLWAAVKTDATGANTTHIDLGLNPEGYVNCDVKIIGGYMIIDVDGVEKVNMDVSFWTWPSYWKAGVYLQTDGDATAYFDDLYTGTPSGNIPPSVSITAPVNGASFADGENVTISADATDSDGFVDQVEFFVDGNSVGVDTSSPYSINWTIGVGSYDITAVATDNELATTTSSSVTITGNTISEMYVSSITTGTQNAGQGNKYGTASVTILDNAGAPVVGASVTGTFSGTFNETVSSITGGNGVVDLITSTTAKGGVMVDLCVDDVTHSSLAYNSTLNIITCTGSSARSSGSIISESLDAGKVAVGLYPNPATTSLIISLTLDEESHFSGNVIGLDGKVLSTIRHQVLSVGSHEVAVDLAHLNKGIYFIEYTLNGDKRISRIIKQ